MEPLYGRVGVFGMGLLGGSVALGLRERFVAGEVHGFDPDPAALETALAMGAVDRVHTAVGDWVRQLDLGILAAPVMALDALARDVAPFAAPGSRWTDVGSVKAPVVAALAQRLPRFVGGHPMAGRETPGMQNAYAGLLQNAVWVLTPTDDTDGADVAAMRQLVEALGAWPLALPPDAHDRAVSRISHAPYLLAVALNLLIARDHDRERLLFLAAGGFRDLTRVASGAPRMSRDMVVENRAAIRDALRDLGAVLDELAADLDRPEALLAAAREAKRTRDALPVVKRTLLPRVFDVVVAIPDRPRALAELATVLADHGVNIRDIEVLKIRGAGGEAIRIGVTDADAQAQARTCLRAAGYRIR